jgi:hypothetical protein
VKVNGNCYIGERLMPSEETLCTAALSSQSQVAQVWNVIIGNSADTVHRNHEIYSVDHTDGKVILTPTFIWK